MAIGRRGGVSDGKLRANAAGDGVIGASVASNDAGDDDAARTLARASSCAGLTPASGFRELAAGAAVDGIGGAMETDASGGGGGGGTRACIWRCR